jgi:hypothetical protein
LLLSTLLTLLNLPEKYSDNELLPKEGAVAVFFKRAMD